MDALALQLEIDARCCSPSGAYRADGTLGNTEIPQRFVVFLLNGSNPSFMTYAALAWAIAIPFSTI